MKANHGFTLIELMIVVAIIAIIAAIALPNLMRARISANEATAAGAMRTLNSSEFQFQAAAFLDADGDGIGDFASLAQLTDPDGAGTTPPFIDSVLGSGTKQGYTYTVATVNGGAAVSPAFTILAAPSWPGKSGYKQFFTDESGVIRFTANGAAATALSTPLS